MRAREKVLFCHRLLARNRALNAILELKRARIKGPVLTGLGAEGLSIGVSLALYESGILAASQMSGDHRTQSGFAVAKNEAFPESHDHAFEILKNYAMAETSANQGEDGNIHWGCLAHGLLPFVCSDMGRLPTVAVGMAEEIRRRAWPEIHEPEKRPIALTVFGEGAANQGAVHEAMNWAAASNCRLNDKEFANFEKLLDEAGRELRVLRGAPIIFVLNQNQFAIYTDAREEHGRSNLAARAAGYGNMRSITANGRDVFDVMAKTKEAVREAQALRPVLLVVETYRLTGHNADQIKRKKPGVLNEGEILGLEPGEFQRAWELSDPLKNCREDIAAQGLATREELEAVEKEEAARMDELFEKAFQEPESVLEDRKKRTVLIPHTWTLPTLAKNPATGTVMRYKEAFVWELGNLLRADPRLTAFGEDIHMGGVLAETAGRGGYLLAKEFGEERVHATPLSEEAIVGVAAGRALMGGKPWCFFQFAPFWADSYAAWWSVIAPNWWQKKLRFGVVAVAPFGVVHSGGSGHYHEACVEGPLYQMDGIALLFPTDAYDLVGLMRAAHEYPGPSVLFLQICAFGDSQFAASVPEEPYLIPFGTARLRHQGKDVSILAYGAASVIAAENEAEFLAAEGIDCEVIDIRCINPLDIETLTRSAEKTGRVVIMHEASEKSGSGVHIKNELDKAGVTLRTRTRQSAYILAAEDNPIPTKPEFLWARLPFEQYTVKPEDNFRLQGTILRSRKLAVLVRDLMRY